MKIKEYVDVVESIDLSFLKNKTLKEVLTIFKNSKTKRLYILKNNRPIFLISTKEIVEILLEKKEDMNIEDFLRDKDYLNCFNASMHVIDAYYQMRKNNILYMPVCEDGKFIGDIDFDMLALKISYIVIKDSLTGLFNKKYFDVLIEEYRNFEKPLGIIFIEVRDLSIYEGLYGVEMREKILKGFAEVLKSSVRKIDFIFRWDNQFRIITFNDLEITSKIFTRIQNRLSNFTIDDIHIPFKMCMSHVPQLQSDILSAIESCEEQFLS